MIQVQKYLIKANKKYDKKYNYDKSIFNTRDDKIIIICPIEGHGEFIMTPKAHLEKNGDCTICRKNIDSSKRKIVFVNKANLKFDNKFNYDLSIYVNTITPLIVICPKHGEFLTTPKHHLQFINGECSKCEREAVRELYVIKFVALANVKYNNKFKYLNDTYVDTITEMTIICPIHGEFQQIPATHLSEVHGCRSCYLEANKKQDQYDMRKNNFIQKSNIVHNYKYGYDKVIYINEKTLVIIVCPNHGDFLKYPGDHMRKHHGCNKCNLCPSCGLFRTFGELCSYCKPANENKLYQATYKKSKEYAVVNFLKDNMPDEIFIHNKSVGNQCTDTHLFPDILFERLCYNVIVEVDEHKHRGASYACDERRMYEIVAKVGVPCVFIRYNPDDKNSDKDVLLDKLNSYLSYNVDNITTLFTDETYGLVVEYLFY